MARGENCKNMKYKPPKRYDARIYKTIKTNAKFKNEKISNRKIKLKANISKRLIIIIITM